MNKKIKDLEPLDRFVYDGTVFTAYNRWAGDKLNIQCDTDDGSFNLFCDGEMEVEMIESSASDEIRQGDMVHIFSSGHGSDAIITANGKPLYGILKAKIEISPDEVNKISLELISPKLSMNAFVEDLKIVGSNKSKITAIKEILLKNDDPTFMKFEIIDEIKKAIEEE